MPWSTKPLDLVATESTFGHTNTRPREPIAYTNAGKQAEAINLLKGILEKRPTDINIINMLAEANYDSKKYDDAIAYYDKLMQISPNNAEALYMTGMCFQKKGEKQKGKAIWGKAIQLDPSLQNLKQEKKMPGGF